MHTSGTVSYAPPMGWRGRRQPYSVRYLGNAHTSMPANAASGGSRSEVDDGVSQELDIELQGIPFLLGQLGLLRVELQSVERSGARLGQKHREPTS